MNVNIRQARLDDIQQIVPFVRMAAGGISEYLLTDLIEGMSVDDILEMALADENTPYYIENFLVAEKKQSLIAAANFYPAENHHLPDIMQSFITKDKIDVIKPYLDTRVDGSMYIHTLAVLPAYRLSAVGFKLAKNIEKTARDKGYQCLSAHVWRDDKLVFNGLKMAGFEEVERVFIPQNEHIKYKNGMVLLKGPDLSL